jgi:hypothetical protein
VLGDRLAHRLARACVLERVVRRALGDAEALRRDTGSRAIEDPHRDPEALTLFAQTVLDGNTSAVEGELAGRRSGYSHLRLEPCDLEPGCARLHEERRDPRMPSFRIGLREDGVQTRDRRIRDEALRAVEDVRVSVTSRRRPYRCGVRARAGLRERVGREDLPGRERREEARLLLLRPGDLESERAELLHRENEAARRAHL